MGCPENARIVYFEFSDRSTKAVDILSVNPSVTFFSEEMKDGVGRLYQGMLPKEMVFFEASTSIDGVA